MRRQTSFPHRTRITVVRSLAISPLCAVLEDGVGVGKIIWQSRRWFDFCRAHVCKRSARTRLRLTILIVNKRKACGMKRDKDYIAFGEPDRCRFDPYDIEGTLDAYRHVDFL